MVSAKLFLLENIQKIRSFDLTFKKTTGRFEKIFMKT
jgi:hypothetical protein